MLDLCKATGLRIANGRIGEDATIGSYTYTNVGSSTIDYLLLKQNSFPVIKNFKVMEFNMFSDHAPLYIEISCCTHDTRNRENHDYEFYKWDSDKKDTFRRGLISQLPLLNDIVKPENLNERNISETVNEFVNVINTVAEPLFRVKGHNSQKGINCKRSSMEWFDRDCKDAKEVYLNALRTFNLNKTTENRENLRYKKKLYKKIVRTKKIMYKRNKYRQIERLRHKKPQDFWRLFSKNRRKASDHISIEDFLQHFRTMATEINEVRDAEAEAFCAQNDNGDCLFEDLDRIITTEEVKTAIKSLKHSKSPGEDNILNEYFIEAGDILLSHLTDIFNGIFNSGVFPESWSKGIIIPVFKKGDPTLVDNYRAITLSSCLSKLFTSILNNRIYSWVEDHDKLSDAQFGFRKERSTVDAIFILQNLIQHVLNDNRRLYCAFVDLRKAFDSVYRNGLWLKLYKAGISGKMLRIIKSIYDQVKSCVKHCSNYSEFFDTFVGLRQGEVMSPVLFALFIEDLELYIQSSNSSGLTFHDISLILLLFADDMVIFGHNQMDLQNSLDMLSEYCTIWGIEVNIEKTKVIVFRKRGRLGQDVQFLFDNSSLEIVDNFNYLGVIMNYTGSFVLNQQSLLGKGLKAMNTLLANVKTYEFKPKTLCQLFDSFVGSVISYGCEVWGYSKSKDLERLHLKFLKRVLGVKLSTSNAGVYGELCRYPLYISRYIRITRYWIKLLYSSNIILQTVYNVSLQDCEKGLLNWVTSIKTLLSQFGFNHVWLNPYSVDPNIFISAFKQRLIDNFIQTWKSDILTNRKLFLYNNFKCEFEYESYLDIVRDKPLRQLLTKLRLSSHTLRIETARYGRNRIDRAERLCLYCDQRQLDDEFHFICQCPVMQDIRNKYIKTYFTRRPSVYKLCELFKSTNKTILTNLCKFIKEAFQRRQSLDI